VKIACIGTGWYPQIAGGLEKYVYGMTSALLRAGDRVDLFVTGDPVVDVDPALRVVPIARPGDRLWQRAVDARRRFAHEFRPPYDAINIHFAMNALPLIPFIDHRTPRIVHFHGPWAAESRAENGNELVTLVKAALERFVYHRADRFIVLSTAFKQLLVGYGIDPSRVTVIPMGIDCEFFRTSGDRRAVRDRLGWPHNKKVLFTARRLINRVGLMELLDAAAIVRTSRSDFAIKIAGKGPLRDALEAAIVERGLAANVELLGFVSEDDLVDAYQAADVTIVPTQSLEGFGTIISESLACGTPVIVTPVGGMPEAVAPLGDGMITRSAAPTDMAERIVALLDGSLRLPDEQRCRSFAVEHFAWDVVCAQIRSVFQTTSSPS